MGTIQVRPARRSDLAGPQRRSEAAAGRAGMLRRALRQNDLEPARDWLARVEAQHGPVAGIPSDVALRQAMRVLAEVADENARRELGEYGDAPADAAPATVVLPLPEPEPIVAAPVSLMPLLARLAGRHPDLVVDVTSDDALVDIVAGGFDAGIGLGEMIAEDMVAVRLTPPFRAVLVAAPDYLARRGEPRAISDLQRHNCINYRQESTGGTYAWEVSEGGAEVAVGVRGTARVPDPLFARELALAGVGIAYLYEPPVRQNLRAGTLVCVLPEAAIEEPGLFLYFPRRAAEAHKLRAFIDTAREWLTTGMLPGRM